jgi:hypothetical protein
VTVRVFSSKFSNEPAEVSNFDGPTVGDWLLANVPSYKQHLTQQFSVSVNGERLLQEHWHQRQVSTLDAVDITVEPKGTELFFGGLFLVATRMMTPKIPKMSSLSNNSGKDLDNASVKGNKIKINDPRPEIAGKRKIYPNYAKPDHRYFAGPRDQRVDLCLDIGVGDFDIQPSDILIGDTPLLSFGADASFAIYPPNTSLAADPRAVWWHDVKEVGSGSNGSPGLDLTEGTPLTPGYTASTLQYNGYDISVVGAGAFPADWTPGLIVRVEVPYQYIVTDGGASRDIISGMPLRMLNPAVGDAIEIVGGSSGTYLVNSFVPYAAEVPATSGSPSTLTASAAPTRFDYNVTPISFTVSLSGTGSYPITLNTATTNLAGLVSAINTAKGSAPFTASSAGGKVVLTQTGANTGGSLTSTAAVAVLGSSPITVAGAAPTALIPEVIPQMTLNFPSGAPVLSFPLGFVVMSIGPAGLRFRVVAATTANLNVSRLTSAGAPDASFPGFQTLVTSGSLISLDASSLQGGYRGPMAMCPEGELTQQIEYDVFCPSGLVFLGSKGEQLVINSNHQFEWRDMAVSGAWTVVQNSFAAASLDAIGKTFIVNLPYPMRPEVRIKKLFISQGGQRSEYRDDLVWYGARARLNGATIYPNSTVIVLTVRGGDRLAAAAENQVSLKATRKLPVRRGGIWQAAEATRDIVPFCLYLLKSVGYTDADLDLAEWDRLDALWRARGDHYDHVHDSASTVQQVIEQALAAGFAELTVKNGLLRPVRDEPQTFYKALYTADATMGQLDIRFDAVKIDDYDGVDVEYMDGIKWQVATVKCRLPGDLGRKVLLIKLNGVTNKTKAYQIGMRRRREMRYRRKTFSWNTEMAALNSNYMDYAQVAGETPGYAQSTIMQSCNQDRTVVTATEPFNWSELLPPYFISVRREDGTNFGPVQVTRVDDYTAALMTPLDFAPILDLSITRPHILFGVGYSVQITEINPNGTDEASVKAHIYAPEVYLDDDSLPPA